MITVNSWQRYMRWNEAVASTVFPELSDSVPAYLDLEEEVLGAIAKAAGHDRSPREGLQDAVRAVTVTGGSFSMSQLSRHQYAWRTKKDYSVPPPSLAFLAITVLAAEDMGSSEGGFDPLDYYSRLCTLLKVPANSADVRSEYPYYAEQLWGDLNRWLEELEGLRGTPTAYALSYRYVGLPMSQALVREGDRRKLPTFFAEYGLPAGMEMAPEVLERYLDAWFSSETCPASAYLKRLWSRPSARERIATVAVVELIGWDGTIETNQLTGARLFQRVGLVVQLRHGFMGSSLDLALSLRHMGAEEFAGRMEVKSSDAEWLPLVFTPAVSNVWRTSYASGLDTASVLTGVVQLRREGTDQVFRHHPRSIVPLIFDELQSAFLEHERLQLNVDSMLLVREEANGKPLARRVTDILATCARPGFTVERDLDGLPEGWVLVAGVQLFGAPAVETYNELVPLARDQLTIAGGMRIPSRVRKWSTYAAPEIRASVESASSLRLVLTDLETTKPVKSWESDSGALVVPLDEASLDGGDYGVALFAGVSKKPLQQATIRLRSADSVDSNWQFAPRLTYALSEPGGAVGAITATEFDEEHPAHMFVDGAIAQGSNGIEPSVSAKAKPIWSGPKHESSPTAVRVGAPDPESCVVTGAHHLDYPTYYGRPTSKYIDGICRYCGLVKRSPAWISSRRPARQTRTVRTPHVEVADLPSVRSTTSQLWDAALDALMHLGGGSSPTALSAIASQIEGGALFASAFPVRFENFGHIAVERLPNGDPTRWEVSPSCLVHVPEGLQLVGFWPDSLVNEILELLAPLGGRLAKVQVDGQPTRRWIEGVDLETAETEVGELVEVLSEVAAAMLEALPSLSQLASQLPREQMPGFEQAERYEETSSSWVQTNEVAVQGAYRLTRGFERMHLFRSADDVQDRLAVRTSVYLAKHLAVNALGKSLAAYLPKHQCVVLPRGCDLPGLYGRAMVMATGKLPTMGKIRIGSAQRDCLMYPGITQDQADLLVTLLSR